MSEPLSIVDLVTAEFDYATFNGERVKSFSFDSSFDMSDLIIGEIAAPTIKLTVNGNAVSQDEVRDFCVHLKSSAPVVRLRELIAIMRDRASRVGSLHTFWDYISYAEEFLAGRRTALKLASIEEWIAELEAVMDVA